MYFHQLTAKRAILHGFCLSNILVPFQIFLILFFSQVSQKSYADKPDFPPPYGLNSPEAIGKFLNGKLPSNTPSTNTGTVTSWKVENAFPNVNFVDPVDMREYPGQNKMVIAGKNGQVWTFQNTPNVSSRTLFLDIRNRVRSEGDCGILGIIFHPQFGQSGSANRGYFYVYYRYTQQKGRSDQLAYVRLSRFRVPDGQSTADPNSEYVMIQQYDRHDWHNGGSMYFGPNDGFLYFIMGDEGGARDEFNSSQKINKNFFGGIHRIDVDKRGGSISHPIRRQPQPPVNPPSGWPGTFSQGYYIPNDNPWVNSNGSVMEEFWALGFRSPHRMWYDPPSGDIWVGDIGQGAREEISIVHKGDNAQWPYKEGFRNGFSSRPGNLIGRDTPPLLDYDRSDGSSVIGGLVYRGNKWASSLGGKYIFSDNVVQNIWTVDYYNSGSSNKQLIATIPFETNVWKDGVSHIFTDQAGEVYILQLAGHNRSGGRIYKLAPKTQTSGGTNAPARLSQTGAFSNLSTLSPSNGVIPYEPNVTFWSDGAQKKRWLALPNNGSHNTASEKIQFSQNGEWTFPSGTVFIKHFDFPVDDRNPNILRKIETRFTVRGDNGQYYFLTYRWREDQSDADLVSSSQDRTLTIQTSSGTRQQVWHYPSNTECVTCHNSSAKQVLGLNTRQLNGNMTYPKTGITANQLETMNHLNWFNTSLNESQIPTFLTLKAPNNASASLEDRARSYLDVNCGYCHQPGALQTSFDLRYTTPLPNQGILNVNPGDDLGISGAKLIFPGDANKSTIYQRLISLHEGIMMPPLAKNKVDEEGKQLIQNWINGMGGSSDTQAPTVPTNLSTSNISSTALTLNWSASSDNVGVVGYQIYQNGTPGPIQTTANNQTSISGLSPNTTYFFAVAAYDAAGNVSGQSQAIQVQTLDNSNGGGPDCTTLINLALNKPASQSSTYGDGVASIAVDGNTDGNGGPWGANAKIIQTNDEAQPWWQVDLGQVADISEVKLFNRTSCCQNRLKQFYILVSNQPFSGSLNSLLNDPTVFSQYYANSVGNSLDIPLTATGRYVRLQMSITEELHFAELQVMGCPSNGGGNSGDPCEGKPNVSISQAGPFTSDQGIQQLQGQPSGGTWSGAAHSNGTFDPTQGAGSYSVSYSVDLGDGCTKTTTTSIQVNSPSSGGGSNCATPTNLALNKPASQSSTYGDGVASIAVDGNTSGGGSPWGSNASISHTNKEAQPWWQVDLGTQADISEVRLFNRSDCCQDRLQDLYIMVSNQPFSGSLTSLLNDPAVQATHFSGQAARPSSIALSTSGRYVRVQLRHSSQIFNIAEVQVMGCPSSGGGNSGDPCEGKPNVSISQAGPFTSDQGIQQLQGQPSGGTWSGAAHSNGTFDPTQGAGSYSVSYSVDLGDGCTKTATTSIQVNSPSSGGGSDCTTPINLALNKPASQSSTYGDGVASIAVDGNTDGNGGPWGANAKIIQTNDEAQPWWQVDLGQVADISEVKLFNRTSCCQNRLKQFYILVSNQPFSGSLNSLLNDPTVFSQYYANSVGNSLDIPLTATGRYVRLQMSITEELHFAELQVMGCPSNGGGNSGDPCEGKPNVSISQAGPFTSDQGIQQLQGQPSGGTWSGAAHSNGTFDPTQGAGSYSVSYSVDLGDGCTKTATTSIQVNSPSSGGGSNCTTPTNLALNKPASQSSTYGDGVASIAVDGNTSGGGSPWGSNASISHTNKEAQPWWQVDLGTQADISEVRLFNRSDCCQDRLQDLYIMVSNQPFSGSLTSLLNDPAVQATHFSGQAARPSSIALSTSGRYVRVQLRHSSQIFNIAEVQVMGCPSSGGGNSGDPCEGKPNVSISQAGPFTSDQGIQQLQGQPSGGTWSGAAHSNGTFDPTQGAGSYSVSYSVDLGDGCTKTTTTSIQVNSPSSGGGSNCATPTNLALNKPASQSSTYGDGVASIAVDGNTSGGGSPWGSNASISHTNKEAQPWWQVDLGTQADISEVRLFNRSDCCQDRLQDLYIMVSNQPFSGSLTSLLNDPAVQATHFSGQAARPSSIALSTSGRYVRVQLRHSSQIFNIAEVQVMGCPSSGGGNSNVFRFLNEEPQGAKEQVRLENSQKISVFPNPFSKELSFIRGGFETNDSQVIITNSLGKTVYKEVWESGSEKLKINTESWVSGVYLIFIQSPKEPVGMKFLKP